MLKHGAAGSAFYEKKVWSWGRCRRTNMGSQDVFSSAGSLGFSPDDDPGLLQTQ